MNTTSEGDKRMTPWNSTDSPSIDNANSGAHVAGNAPLKKGPWTLDEDAILAEYVLKHGEGKWNNIQKNSVLARCGKSCRLRWINHLRPDLKKGGFSREEERRVIELHARMGNKWSLMADELPGRTDNEIKNFWHTRVKRNQRSGLPIYPPDIYLQALIENRQNDLTNTFSSGYAHHPDFVPNNNCYIPTVGFTQPLYPPALLDISASRFSPQILNAYNHGSTSNHALSSSAVPGSHVAINGNHSFPDPARASSSQMLNAYDHGLTSNHAMSSSAVPGSHVVINGNHSFPDPARASSSQMLNAYDHGSTSNHALSSSAVLGSHVVINGNHPFSDPARAMKPELPSLRSQRSSLCSPSSLFHTFECLNPLIPTPPTELTQPFNLETDGNCFLEAVLYESKCMKNSNNNYRQQTSRASDMVVDVMDRSPISGNSLAKSGSMATMSGCADSALPGDANWTVFM